MLRVKLSWFALNPAKGNGTEGGGLAIMAETLPVPIPTGQHNRNLQRFAS